MRIGICDDNEAWYEQAEDIILDYAKRVEENIETFTFGSKQELLSYEGLPLTAVFLDIQLKEDNGIEVAAEINEKWKNCQIIYLTNYLFYAMDIYHTEHVFFVLKEQFSARVAEVFGKIKKIIEEKEKKIMVSVVHGGPTAIAESDIYYLERKQRYTVLYSVWGEFQIHEKLEEMLKKLSDIPFSRCHNSFVVNFLWVERKEKNSYVLQNKQEVVISRSYAKKTKEDFMRWALLHMS